MKTKVGIIISVCLLVYSCTSKTIYEKPKDLIPKDTMVFLLKDLHLAAAAKNVTNKQLQRRFSYVPLVFQKYQIDSVRFQKSNLYYTSKIDIYEPLFDEVLKSLEEERTLFARQKKVIDSLRQDSIKTARKLMNQKKKQDMKMDQNVKKKKQKFMMDKGAQ